MKRILTLLGAIITLAACHKNNFQVADENAIAERILQSKLSAADFRTVDLSSLQAATLRSGHHIYRLKMGKENVVIETDGAYQFLKGSIYAIEGTLGTFSNHIIYTGIFSRTDLQRKNTILWGIKKGYIRELHSYSTVTSNGLQQATNVECSDCTIPEVIVSTSYPSGGGTSWSTWMNLLALFDIGSQNDFISVDWTFGGGSGGSSAGPVVTIDQENTESKAKIDPKKYMDCFGSIPDANATYTVTISTDIPVDGHPETFFDPSTASVGHAFIELYKAGQNGGIISQNFGFYPNTDIKAIGGYDVTSKVVDNAYHEYNARYTISVTASQFQAAISTVNAISSNAYNLITNNCTDFALAVFNAAGGNLSIPKYQIPGYPSANGSNTPQGIYNKLGDMAIAGNQNVQTNANKAYGGSSHGPCN